mmetsp:Transcript_2382/g.7864  ORF Transcript_2382/g.7864 Transcript_2382/m.7864 type:complete len:211 (-) Transcript_2382:214-846(-)
MVIGLRFKCHTLQTSRVTVSPVSRDSPLETSGRSPARAYELDTSRSPPSKGVRNHPARLSSNISQGRPSVNRAASYLSSPSPACPPVWRAPLPERPPDPSPPAAAAPLPARARPTAPRGRRRRAAPAPASRATAATRRVPMHHTWSIATVTARHRQNSAHMRGMVLRCIVVVWENHLTDLACCRSPVRADRCRDDKVSVATIVGANQPSA